MQILRVKCSKEIKQIEADKEEEKSGQSVFFDICDLLFPIPFGNEIDEEQKNDGQLQKDRKRESGNPYDKQCVKNVEMDFSSIHRCLLVSAKD